MKKIKIKIYYTGNVKESTGDYILQQIPGISILKRNLTNNIHEFEVNTLNESLVMNRAAYIENTNNLVYKVYVQ